MKTRIAFFLTISLFLAVPLPSQGQATVGQSTYEQMERPEGRPITFEDMYAIGRVTDPQLSPDGKSILYVVTYYSLEQNNSNADIYSVDIQGKESKRLTNSPKNDANPRWSPDGRTIAFISSREGIPQIWLMDIDGGNQRKLTSISTGASGVEWSPEGSRLIFSSSVYADCPNDDCNAKRDEENAKNPVKAMRTNRIPYRVWNSWTDGKFSHAFVVSVKGGTPVDVTPGEFHTPPIDIGGHQDYIISPDGNEVAFVKNTDKLLSASTNNDIWLANIDGSHPRCITTANKANDNNPVYSPDGKYIAYRAMRRAGFEADKYDLIVYNRATQKILTLTDGVDRSVDEIVWTPDSKRILFTAEDEAYISLFEIPALGGDVLRVLKGIVTLQFDVDGKKSTLELGTTRTNFRLHRDGKTLVFLGQRMDYPTEVMSCVYEAGQVKDFRQITFTNAALLDSLEMNPPESFTFRSFDGADVQGWIVTPPKFDPTVPNPTLFLVHGGPQGMWGNDFHYRWNLELFASFGFVVVAINPRGSVGFGQKFTDGVTGDWGGAPFRDLMTGLDFVIKNYPYVDPNNLGAAGASYGGYMMNWFLGNTTRFKALFTHAGVYDLVSMYGGTEELWFPEWEFKGTPWTNAKLYEKWSPSKYAKNFRTPTYVSHGQQDFRVPVEQGMQLFSTLQRLGVESRFLYFPDESHLVLKPRNAQLWYSEFRDWFRKHLHR